MPIHVIPQDQDPRRTLVLAICYFHLDLEHFPMLTRTLEAPTMLSVWPSYPKGAKKAESNDTEKPGTAHGDGLRAVGMRDFDSIVSPAPAASFDRFMNLPVELREVIWELTLWGSTQINRATKKCARYLVSPVEIRDFLKKPNNNARPTFLPSMCRISKSTMSETIGVYIRGSQFSIASIHDNRFLDGFLQTVSKGYDNIRTIHFAFFDCFPPNYPQNADLELAVRCSGLHTIKLTFHVERLRIWVLDGEYDDGLTGYPRPLNEMWTHYKFVRLTECNNLQKVVLERKGRSVDAAVGASRTLGNHIKEEYKAKHNREIAIGYTWAERSGVGH